MTDQMMRSPDAVNAGLEPAPSVVLMEAIRRILCPPQGGGPQQARSDVDWP